MNDFKKLPSSPWRYFIAVSKPYRWWAGGGIIIATLASTVGAGSSYFFKLIVDAIDAGDPPQQVVWLVLLYPTVIFITQGLYRLSGYLTAVWTTRVAKYSYDNLIGYTLRHGHHYFSNRLAGAIANKIRNVVSSTDEIIPEIVWTQLYASVHFSVTIGLLCLVNPWLAVIFVVMALSLIGINLMFGEKKAALSKTNAETLSVLQGQTIDVITNAAAVRQFTRTQAELDRLASLSYSRLKASLVNWLYTEKILLINTTLLFIFGVTLFYYTYSLFLRGLISAGDLVLVLALMSQITGTLLFIGRSINAFARTLGELREGLEELLVPYDIVDQPGAKKLQVEAGQIEFKAVSFAFGPNQVLKDFSLTIKPKERVGVVGVSGAGKSTLVSLLLRQHDLARGQILIDGQDIAAVTQDSLRAAIGVVPQEPLLFHRTIKENILYGKPEADMEQLRAAAQAAEAHDFVSILPQGYDTLVGERGVKLSGGQKQRVAIARTILKDAPILILDEATSALDSESEVVIQKALHTLMQNRTVIAIAHRLSTLREMDRIIVLESGAVVEDGTHEELVVKGALYARLWSHQAGGFLLD